MTYEKYIYKTGPSWSIRIGKKYHGRCATLEEAIIKRNILLKNPIFAGKKCIKRIKINKKYTNNNNFLDFPYIEPKPIDQYIDNTPEIGVPQINFNNLSYLDEQPPSVIKNNVFFPEQNVVEMEPNLQIEFFINELQNKQKEMKEQENKIKTNLQKLLSSFEKENELMNQLNQLEQRQITLLDKLTNNKI